MLKSAWKGSHESEPMGLRTAVLGIILGFGLLILVGFQIGITPWVGVFFFGVYFILSIAVTRMRAELGPLVHELYYSNSDQVLSAIIARDV